MMGLAQKKRNQGHRTREMERHVNIPNRSICGGQRRRGTDSEEDKATRCTLCYDRQGLGQEVKRV